MFIRKKWSKMASMNFNQSNPSFAFPWNAELSVFMPLLLLCTHLVYIDVQSCLVEEKVQTFSFVTVCMPRFPLSGLCLRFRLIYLTPAIVPTSTELSDCLESYLILISRLCLLRISWADLHSKRTSCVRQTSRISLTFSEFHRKDRNFWNLLKCWFSLIDHLIVKLAVVIDLRRRYGSSPLFG